MPQLKSGRHVALSASTLLEAITNGSDESKSSAIMIMRLHVHSPAQLRDHIVVGCFEDGEGDPIDPETICHHSGFSVGKILDGKTDWTQEEIDEFRMWLDTNPKIDAWLQEQYDDIDAAIQNNPVWKSPLWMDD